MAATNVFKATTSVESPLDASGGDGAKPAISDFLTLQSFTNFATGHDVRAVREDRNRRGLFYAGTEYGMYVSFDDGANWQSLQLNLPVTPVSDLQVARQDLVLSTFGRGLWVLDDLSVLEQLDPRTATDRHRLFKPRDDTYSLFFYLYCEAASVRLRGGRGGSRGKTSPLDRRRTCPPGLWQWP